MLRTVIALIAGFAILAFGQLVATIVLAFALGVQPGVSNPAFYPGSLACGALAAAVGGYATAALAPRRHGAHVLVLMAMILMMALSNVITPPAGQPGWYLAAALVAQPAFAGVGGLVRAATTRTP
jgi:hypothetical protein